MSSIVLDNYMGRSAHGHITLTGSKSISNRVLIIQALCEETFKIHNLSSSDDTQTLKALLSSDPEVADAHHAGTTFRFLTAFLSVQEGVKTLTGSDRMKQRPVGPLVDALTTLGADIQYIENEGYPPLLISGKKLLGGRVKINAEVSSQFITAVLLIAPSLDNGIVLELEGELVSRPYVEMTLKIMEYFGIQHTWEGNTIDVRPQKYEARDFYVEGDWSSASYYYSFAALSDTADITIYGLQKNSLQGDSVIAAIGERFGVETTYHEDSIRLKKDRPTTLELFEYDFSSCPDIAQTVSVMCAGLGVQGLFSGLKTLYIKETDRVAAVKNELTKVMVSFTKLPPRFSSNSGIEYHMVDGKASADSIPFFATYQDHRMAMAFAPLSLLFPIEVQNKDVVSKSYPTFWEDLETLFR